MILKLDSSAVKLTTWSEYAIRFLIGGLITAFAGLIAEHYGPAIGGLSLAFPAICPAAVTLIAKYEREKKVRKGLHGARRGIKATAVDAFGTVLGSIGLAAFALTSWQLLPAHPALVLLLATLTWLAVGGFAWALWKGRIGVMLRTLKRAWGS